MWSLVGLSAHPTFHWWSAHCVILPLLFSDELMRCCAESPNVCLDLRRRALANGRRMSAEWSRCPDAMAQRNRDMLAPLQRSSAGWMPARMGRLSAGVGRRYPVTIGKALLMVGSIRQVWALRDQIGAQYSGLNKLVLRWLFATLLFQHPNRSQQSAWRARLAISASCEVTRGVGDIWATCPTLLRGI